MSVQEVSHTATSQDLLRATGADGGAEVTAEPVGQDEGAAQGPWTRERLQATLRRGLGATLRTVTDVLRPWYRPAERGHARALHILGKKLEERDAARAEECFRWAARTGDIDAIADLGVVIAMRGDLEAAQKLLEQAASSGHARAMYNLGVLSEGVDADKTEEWYRKAATAGFADAMYNLGVHLEAHYGPKAGPGGPRPSEEAEEWYRRAAGSGHTHAMNNLGARLQRRGELREAELQYKRAAQAGNSDAMNNLGAMLERRGERAQARAWYRRSAESGDLRGMINLAAALERRGEIDEAERWHRLADPDWTPRRKPDRRR